MVDAGRGQTARAIDMVEKLDHRHARERHRY
jgi:hypothetical protein